MYNLKVMTLIRTIIFLVTFAPFLLFGIVPAEAEVIHLATGKDYPPFTSPNLPQGGFSTAVVTRIFKSAGHDVKMDWVPWKRGYMQARSTKYLGTFPYVKADDRVKDFLFSDVIGTSTVSVVTSNVNNKIESYSDLSGYRVCLPLGYSAGEVLQGYIDRNEVEVKKVKTLSECLSLLEHDTHLFFNLDTAVAAGVNVKYPSLKFFLMKEDFTELHFIISKKYPDAEKWMKLFNTHLAGLRASGEFDEIKQVYFSASPE